MHIGKDWKTNLNPCRVKLWYCFIALRSEGCDPAGTLGRCSVPIQSPMHTQSSQPPLCQQQGQISLLQATLKFVPKRTPASTPPVKINPYRVKTIYQRNNIPSKPLQVCWQRCIKPISYQKWGHVLISERQALFKNYLGFKWVLPYLKNKDSFLLLANQ